MDDAEVGVRLGVSGPDAERAFVTSRRRIELALRLKRDAEVVMRLGIVRPDGERALVTSRRRIELALRKEDHAEIIVKRGRPRVLVNGLADQFYGGVCISQLMVENAKEMQSVGMTGIGLEYLEVEPFRFLQAARLMRSPRRLQTAVVWRGRAWVAYARASRGSGPAAGLSGLVISNSK